MSTAYGLRTPAVFAPVKAASACGTQPAASAACPAGASRARWALVSLQPFPRAAKNSPAGPPPPAVPAVAGRAGAGGGGRFGGWLPGRFGCNRCTPWLRRWHPAGALAAPRSRRGVHLLHLAGHAIHSFAGAGRGVRWLRRVRPGVRARRWRGGQPGGAAGDLAPRHRDAGLGKVVADHAEVQVPALRPPVGALDPRRDQVRVAG
ncbi:MAG: hypothetical protein JO132_04575 [Streptosporangiaceae bacterium]|nr:hypothetical protein [Streptosporangiaceae bacterium]